MRDGGAQAVFDRYEPTGEPNAPISAPAFFDSERFHSDKRIPSAAVDSTRPARADLGQRIATLCRNRFAAATLEHAPTLIPRRDEPNRKRLAELETQLRSAGELQRNLQSLLPSIRGAEVSILQRPAGLVGGDVCEIFRVDAGRVGIAVADASGHDLAAGMLAMFVSRLIRSLGSEADGDVRDPAGVLGKVNGELCRSQLEECHFVTAFYGVFDEGTRVLRWSRAGAPHPLLIGSDGDARPLYGRGSLLGAIEEADFEVVETRLRPGETLLVFTDGLADSCGEPNISAMDCAGGSALKRGRRFGRSVEERFAGWERRLAASDAQGSERDDVTVMALGILQPDRLTIRR